MKDNIEQRIIAVFVVMLAVLTLVAAAAIRNIRLALASSDWVNHTHAVILEADAVLSSLRAGEAALGTYLLTGDARDQAAYRAAYGDVAQHLEVGKALTRGEPAQHQKFVELEPLLQQRVAVARQLVQARAREGLAGARAALVADAGNDVPAQIRRLVSALREDENTLLRARDRASYQQAQTTRWTVFTGLGLNFLLLVAAGWLVRDDLAARRRAAAAMAEANAQLETKVRERTAELATANEALRQENLERRWSNQALDHQLRYSQLIINSISDQVFVISKALNISRVNPAAEHHTGLGARELIGLPMQRVLRWSPPPPAGTASSSDPISLALKEGREIQDWPGAMLARSEPPTPVRFSVVPLRDHDKVVGGVVTVRVCAEGASPPA